MEDYFEGVMTLAVLLLAEAKLTAIGPAAADHLHEDLRPYRAGEGRPDPARYSAAYR